MKSLLGLLVAVIVGLSSGVSADHDLGAQAQESRDAGTLTVAFSRMLLSDVNTNDALAAAKVWITQLVDELGDDDITRSETYLVSNMEEYFDLQATHEIDVAILHPVEFVQYEKNISLVPRFTAVRDGETAYGVSLMVRSDSGIRHLKELSGKRLASEQISVGLIPELWIRALLDEKGLPEPGAFFGERKFVPRVTQSALAVYFGQADACTVKLDSYKTLVEMNPQVGASLVAIEESMVFCRTVLCVREPLTAESGRVSDALRILHETAKGHQLLTMFNIDQLVPYEPHYLDGVRSLLSKVDPGDVALYDDPSMRALTP